MLLDSCKPKTPKLDSFSYTPLKETLHPIQLKALLVSLIVTLVLGLRLRV